MVRAFISYASADEEAALRLAAELERRQVLVTRMDRFVVPGESWVIQLQNSIENSDVVFVLVSPNSLQSEWATSEIAFAVSQAERGRTRVVPVLLSPNVELPFLLKYMQPIELFDPVRSQQQIELLLKSIGSSSPPTQEQAAQTLEANFDYVKAARRALHAEIAIREAKQAARVSTIASVTAGAVAVIAMFAVIFAFGMKLDTGKGFVVSLVLAALGGASGSVLATWLLLRRRLRPRVPNGEAE